MRLWCVENSIICGTDVLNTASSVGHWWVENSIVWDTDVLKTASSVGHWWVENSIVCGTLMCWRQHRLWEDIVCWTRGCLTKRAEQCPSQIQWSNFIPLTEKHWNEKRPDAVEIPAGPIPSVLLRNTGVKRDQTQWRSQVDQLHQSTVAHVAFINAVNISNDCTASLPAGFLLPTWSCDGVQCCQWKCAVVLSSLSGPNQTNYRTSHSIPVALDCQARSIGNY